ncbi:hypothetical protein MLD38_040373 [Melastoma candidum]|uniref:Uncharacterized protein n=1 Tax=Melastoma candidum TaxID=119954 RepID=A0ACB9L532_9MYRT|nr:hypothetical protein MLD38_040373 [Melastoma candidum]
MIDPRSCARLGTFAEFSRFSEYQFLIAMCQRNIFWEGLESSWTASAKRLCKKKRTGMEFKLDQTKRSKTSAHNSHAIRTATSFMPWSCRVPIGEGYHEFL